jgi:hypothetical protein
MSVQGKSWSRRWGRKIVLPSWIVPAALVIVVAGCGGSSGDDVTAAKAHAPAPCRTGGRIAPHVADPPASWASGPGPAIALSCSGDGVDPGAAIVGYPLPGEGSCVTAYSSSLGEAFGELCEPTGTGWTSQCERAGCVHYFSHQKASTVLVGPVPGNVSSVWASINGKQVLEGVALASVHGKLMRAIGSKEPFGFFTVYVPRCVEPEEVKVHLVAGGSKQIGLADEWDVEEAKCPAGHSGPASS